MPLLLIKRNWSGPASASSRMPSHLISNAQPVSSTGNAAVTAFIGRSCSNFTDYNTRMASTTGPLAGQTAFITGGGSGIGFASARALVRDGASVLLMGRNADRLRDAVASLEAEVPSGARIGSHAGDVASED